MKISEMKSIENDDKAVYQSHLFSRKSRRILTALMLLFGGYCSQAMKSHLGVAMVCMVNATAVHELSTPLNVKNITENLDSQCQQNRAETISIDKGYRGTFTWSNEQQSLIFQASFYGNLIILWFSGFLVDRYGPKIIAFIGVLGMSIITFLTPTTAYLNFYMFVGIRIIFGAFENLYSPSRSAMATRWYPDHEKSTVAAIFSSSNELANSLGVLIASGFCIFPFFDGWPLIFYFLSSIGIIWMVIWWLWATDLPSDSKFLSPQEKAYLHDTVEIHHSKQTSSHQPFNFRYMLTSSAVWAIVVGEFSYNFANTLMLAYLPTYFRDVLAIDMKQNGLFTALPFTIQLLSKMGCGILSDFFKRKKLLSSSVACRVFQVSASIIATIVFIIMALFIDCTTPCLALFLLSAYGIAAGATVSGSYTSSLCIAPMYTGTIATFVMIAAALANILAPAVVGIIIKEGTQSEWSMVFGIASMIYAVGGVVFFIFGTAKIQVWAEPSKPQI